MPPVRRAMPSSAPGRRRARARRVMGQKASQAHSTASSATSGTPRHGWWPPAAPQPARAPAPPPTAAAAAARPRSTTTWTTVAGVSGVPKHPQRGQRRHRGAGPRSRRRRSRGRRRPPGPPATGPGQSEGDQRRARPRPAAPARTHRAAAADAGRQRRPRQGPGGVVRADAPWPPRPTTSRRAGDQVETDQFHCGAPRPLGAGAGSTGEAGRGASLTRGTSDGRRAWLPSTT